ncbi:TetR/AcrR family transcriptional regulator [Nocardioides speluncae]|uniref:TetR/AcrR family transcriptional regulator n=1 Tax=Nocardioides speluncae TaxID=2670337 RepID=UPI000D69B276|nr:TetR family transcriptional regulator C-terminal domain-containing protein [Nocardioides speluncae]
MPKTVDHEARRVEIAEALMRVVRRDGYAGISVRNVATEAGWSAGAMRYYFASQAELLSFALLAIADRMGPRIDALLTAATDLHGIEAALAETLPITEELRAESEVWLGLVAASRTDRTLRPLAERAHTALRGFYVETVRRLAEVTGADFDQEAESVRLHALIDGLAIQGTLYPDQLTPDTMRAVVRRHLTSLTSG